MKQSNQLFLPQLQSPVPFATFTQAPFSGQKFIAHCDESHRQSLQEALKTQEDVLILIGPEGDFSVKEIESACAKGFVPITLGNTRLRTETAAVVACHSVVFKNEAYENK
jgi:16S rRNA (uracil1498-N3)-methyltransferase